MKRITKEVSKWNIFQHRHARDLPGVEKDDLPTLKLQDELFDRLYAGGSDTIPEAEQGPMGSWASRLHTAAEALPAFTRLAEDCRDDADASATAVEVLMHELEPTLRAEEQNTPVDDAALRKGLTRFVVKAGEKIAEQREQAEALADVALRIPGTATGKGGKMEEATPRQIASRLKNDARLRRIAMLAGKFTRIAARKQRMKVNHGRDEITDVETGSDIGRLLPVELGALAHPLRKLTLFRNLIEGSALQYRMEGNDNLGKGPIVVMLDKSGSMNGAPDEWATAVALALMWIAQKQKRRFALLGFDGAVKAEHVVDAGDPLPEAALFTGCYGGTSIERAFVRGLDIIEQTTCKLRKADIVLITDGASDASNVGQIRERAAKLGVTCLGFGIGVDRADLQPWCDEVQAVRNLSTVDDHNSSMFSI